MTPQIQPADSPKGDVNPADRPSEFDYYSAPVIRPEHSDDVFTLLLEQQATKVPSNFFLFVALGAMAASLVFEISGRHRKSQFVGMWPAPLLIMGLYNKLVKTLHST